MDLINKALALCAEIEARQKELRDILQQIVEERTSSSNAMKAEPDIAVEPEPEPEVEDASEPAVAEPESLPDPEPVVAESAVSVKQADSQNDLRKAFTINDRFRFRRELFGGSDKAFAELVDRLSDCADYVEVEKYIETLNWNSEDEAVAEFKAIVSNYFNGYHL